MCVSLRSPASPASPGLTCPLEDFGVGGCARDPSSATNVTLRHHECDLRRDPTRRGAGVRAPSLTRMGSRACYRGWRFKQGPLDLSWGNGSKNQKMRRSPSRLGGRSAGSLCVLAEQTQSPSPPSLWNSLLPGTFYQGNVKLPPALTAQTTSNHLLDSHASLQLHSLPAAPSHRLLSPALVAFCRDEPLLGQTGPV